MEHEQVEKVVAQKSVWIYLPISIGSALLFWLTTKLSGDYPTVARIGGMGRSTQPHRIHARRNLPGQKTGSGKSPVIADILINIRDKAEAILIIGAIHCFPAATF